MEKYFVCFFFGWKFWYCLKNFVRFHSPDADFIFFLTFFFSLDGLYTRRGISMGFYFNGVLKLNMKIKKTHEGCRIGVITFYSDDFFFIFNLWRSKEWTFTCSKSRKKKLSVNSESFIGNYVWKLTRYQFASV